MGFWEHFFRLVGRRPLPAFGALYWHLTRRKVRARNLLRRASVDFRFPYRAWVIANEETDSDERCRATANLWSYRPTFSVLLHSGGQYSREDLERTARSLRSQAYPFWPGLEAAIAEVSNLGTKGSGAAGAAPGADFVVPVRIGDVLSRTALFRFAEALQANPNAIILYGDHDHLDERGDRHRPWFKPRWNEEMFLAQDYLSPAVALKCEVVGDLDIKATEQLPIMLAAAANGADGLIVHIPGIICHRKGTEGELDDRRIHAIAACVEPLGATCERGPFGTTKVNWPLPDQLPLITIIVPTKDKLELLRACAESVLERTSYPNYELLIVDNASVEKRTSDYLSQLQDHPNVRVVEYAGAYNFSAINNFAAEAARGSYLCLLNNDTEVISPEWLTELLRQAARPHVGAVGAKLLYGDGTIQHAGIVIGIGGAAGHAHRFLPANQPGYFRMPHVSQYVSAVTAACLLVDKRKFHAVGGLDEVDLRIAFNDVDFCLKLEAAGWRNVYVPHAVLLHHESKSRGLDSSPANVERFRGELATLQERWDTETYDDPLFNPHLDNRSERFVLDA